jgi:histone H3/H4
MSKTKLAAAECFVSNPTIEEFHQTSDGSCFTNENAAISHAKTLGSSEEDLKVAKVKRAAVKEQIEEVKNADKKASEKAKKAAKEAAKKAAEEAAKKAAEEAAKGEKK